MSMTVCGFDTTSMIKTEVISQLIAHRHVVTLDHGTYTYLSHLRCILVRPTIHTYQTYDSYLTQPNRCVGIQYDPVL